MFRRLPFVLALAACLALAWELLVLLPHMPATMASKFGFDGSVRNTMSREAFGWGTGSIMAAMAASFALVGLIRRLPDRMINMPAKDYWLAPERREATLDDLCATVHWILASAMALIAGAVWLSIDANRSQPPRLSSTFLWMMAAFVAVFVVALAYLAKRFRRPKI